MVRPDERRGPGPGPGPVGGSAPQTPDPAARARGKARYQSRAGVKRGPAAVRTGEADRRAAWRRTLRVCRRWRGNRTSSRRRRRAAVCAGAPAEPTGLDGKTPAQLRGIERLDRTGRVARTGARAPAATGARAGRRCRRAKRRRGGARGPHAPRGSRCRTAEVSTVARARSSSGGREQRRYNWNEGRRQGGPDGSNTDRGRRGD